MKRGQRTEGTNESKKNMHSETDIVICMTYICPGSSEPIYIVSYEIKWVTTFGHTVMYKVLAN